MNFSNQSLSCVEEVKELFRRHSVKVIYLKELALKMDNDKNQIYLGKSLNEVSNIFPIEIDQRGVSSSIKKRGSKFGHPISEGNINFCWMNRSGSLFSAPHAKIIDYFQYPEIRFSGFLKNCEKAPPALRRKNQAQFGKRVILMGVTRERVRQIEAKALRNLRPPNFRTADWMNLDSAQRFEAIMRWRGVEKK